MSSDSINSPATEASPPWDPESVFSHRTLTRNQRIHAIAITSIPAVGTIIALCLVPVWGLGWLEIGLFLGMYALTATGMEVGFHRLLSHRSFRVGPVTETVLVICGSMFTLGPAINWVSSHRRHHAHTDAHGDPHSPHLHPKTFTGRVMGFIHSYVGWIFGNESTNSASYSKDQLRNHRIVRLSQLYYYWVLLGIALPAAVGGMIEGHWTGAVVGALWGGFVRIFVSHQAAYSLTSFSHLFGSRPFKTRDRSTNLFVMAIPTWGQSWHNNHHAFPSSAMLGLRWWQIDPAGYVIGVLRLLGLAKDVKRPSNEEIARQIARSRELSSARS